MLVVGFVVESGEQRAVLGSTRQQLRFQRTRMELPTDVQRRILGHLHEPRWLAAAQLVCRSWRQIIVDKLVEYRSKEETTESAMLTIGKDGTCEIQLYESNRILPKSTASEVFCSLRWINIGSLDMHFQGVSSEATMTMLLDSMAAWWCDRVDRLSLRNVTNGYGKDICAVDARPFVVKFERLEHFVLRGEFVACNAADFIARMRIPRFLHFHLDDHDNPGVVFDADSLNELATKSRLPGGDIEELVVEFFWTSGLTVGELINFFESANFAATTNLRVTHLLGSAQQLAKWVRAHAKRITAVCRMASFEHCYLFEYRYTLFNVGVYKFHDDEMCKKPNI